MKECTGQAKEKEGEFDEMANTTAAPQKEFIFIRLSVLREVCVSPSVFGSGKYSRGPANFPTTNPKAATLCLIG